MADGLVTIIIETAGYVHPGSIKGVTRILKMAGVEDEEERGIRLYSIFANLTRMNMR